MSGDERDESNDMGDGSVVAVNGARDKSRMHCVMVGWKRPPCGE